MTPDRWSAVKKVLESALDRPLSERSDFLAEACGADDVLRAEVEALLEAHLEAGEFLEHSPAAPPSPIGTTVGSYRILEVLGAGGMGEVYLALDTRLGRHVALKFLSSQFTSNPDRVHRFRQEARAASALNHPNILTIYELGEHHGVQFIASEVVEGETLRKHLDRGPMELSEIVRVASQVASALRTAHAAGVVHRDIKPENVMLRPDGYVKVLDFGLAKLSEPSGPLVDAGLHTASGVVMGTTQYMSPEQVRGQVVDARTDQWSLGVVLHEMLSGRRPFEESTASDVIAAILGKEHPPLQAPRELRRITARLLRKKREERYPTASDLCSDLDAFQKRSDAGPVSPKRKLRVAGLAAAVVILVASILILNRDRIFQDQVPPPAEIRSIAVLPFRSMNGDNGNEEHLGLGMADALINKLSGLRQITIRPTRAILKYTEQEDMLAAGRELGVDAVLVGSVQRAGERFRVSVQLVNVRDGRQLWAERFDVRFTEIFTVEDRVSEQVARAMNVNLSPAERSRLIERHTDNPRAYEDYLKGRYFWNKRTEDGYVRAISHFQRALAEDGNFARAWAGLADSYALLGSMSTNFIRRDVAMPKAREAALHALSLDNTLAEAHTSLAFVLMHYQWDFEGASREFERAFELNPGYATAHHWYAYILVVHERFDDAIASARRAEQLDPLSLIISTDVAEMLFYARRYDESIAQLRKTLDLDSHFPIAHRLLAWNLIAKGEYEAAAQAGKKAVAEGLGYHLTLVVYLDTLQGRTAQARQTLRRLEAMYPAGSGQEFSMVGRYATPDEKDRAFALLEEAYREHSGGLILLHVSPEYDHLRNDPRFIDLARRVGVPPR